MGGGIDTGLKVGAYLGRQTVNLPKKPDVHIVGCQLGGLLADCPANQIHQRLHFLLRTIPVFG